MKQVLENTESRKRQYDLAQHARALGWPQEAIVVIDSDLGQSAASAADRAGFQRLVTDVGMGRAGVVMGLEVSRLARNSSDWHRLLEICTWTRTLILDEDGLYDPTQLGDRLLLGLKGTMSEAELYQIRARLVGGMLNKARRGELRVRLPVGFVHTKEGPIALDPDREVQESIRLLFETFRRTGSAHRTLRYFREEGLEFPQRLYSGPHKGEIVWRDLRYGRVIEVLRNPCFAGAYCYGRRKQRRVDLEGHTHVSYVPREEWYALLVNAHEGYISWEEFENNQKTLLANALGPRGERKYAPREGPALLQGLAVCGVCGKRMNVRYRQQRGHASPYYVCQGERPSGGLRGCQDIPGEGIDQAIGSLLLELVTPFTLEVALAVGGEIEARIEDADRLRRRHVERARYEAGLARRRYMQVDPDHRLVADSLESEWNAKLRELSRCEEENERARAADRLLIDEQMRSRVLALARDFPRVWRDPRTPHRERKRMVRLLIEDVTLRKSEFITVHVRFRGGATKSLGLPRPLSAWLARKVAPGVVAEIDRLLEEHTEGEIARILNDKELLSGCGHPFDARRVHVIRPAYRLASRYTRLHEKGWLSLREVSRKLGTGGSAVRARRARGSLGLASIKLNDIGQHMYEDPDIQAIETMALMSTRAQEV